MTIKEEAAQVIRKHHHRHDEAFVGVQVSLLCFFHLSRDCGNNSDIQYAIQEVMRVIGDPFESIEIADYLLKTLASSLDGRRSVAEFYAWTGAGSNGK